MRPEWDEIESRRKRSEGGSRAIFAVAGIFGLAYVVWAYVAGGKVELQTEQSVQIATERTASVPITPRTPTPTVYQQPARVTQGRQTYVGVYECVVNGQRVVSDKPCGPGAQARVLEVDQPDPRDVARQRQRTWAAQQSGRSSHAPRSSSVGAAPVAKEAARPNDAACASIDQQIEQIDARMRQGYTSQEGEWYRQRLRELKERRHELGCSR